MACVEGVKWFNVNKYGFKNINGQLFRLQTTFLKL